MIGLRRCALVAVVILGTAAPAAAQGWGRGWLERLSGPGPFGGSDWRVTVGCIQEKRPRPAAEPATQAAQSPRGGGDEDRAFVWIFQNRLPGPATLCVDAEASDYENDPDERPAQGLVTFGRKVGIVMWMVPKTFNAVELGAGAGWLGFRRDTFEVDRFVIPIRAIVKPLRFFWPNRNASGIVQIVYTGNIIPASIDNEDFGITDYEFEHRYLEPENRYTLMFDFSALVFRR